MGSLGCDANVPCYATHGVGVEWRRFDVNVPCTCTHGRCHTWGETNGPPGPQNELPRLLRKRLFCDDGFPSGG